MSTNQEALIAKEGKKQLDTDGDTVSSGFESDTEYEVIARRRARGQRKMYRAFIKDNKSFWMWFNLTLALFCMGSLAGTYFILENDESSSCLELRFVLWAVVVTHALNVLVCFINLCGLEIKLCNSNFVCCFALYELLILVWMQFAYFKSQGEDKCM